MTVLTWQIDMPSLLTGGISSYDASSDDFSLGGLIYGCATLCYPV